MSLEKMKIKIVRIITRMDLGGAQQAVLHLARRLDQSLFEQILITGEGGELSAELCSIPSIKCYILPSLSRRVGLGGLLDDLRTIIRIRSILRQEVPEIAHTHTPKAGILGRWAAWMAGIPRIIHTFHGFGFSEFQPSGVRRLYIWVERLTSLITTRFVVVAESNRLKGQEYRIFGRADCDLIRSGIDFSAFGNMFVDKSKKKLELGFAPSDKIVGIVAGFKPPKALHHFVTVARRVSDQRTDIKFLMVGDGELREQLEEHVDRLHLDSIVKMVGWRRDVPEFLEIFDVFLLTSLWEGLPRVVVEAMITGVPVVAPDVDGIAEVVRSGETGYLVSPGDTASMAQRVIELLDNETLRRQMGRAAKGVGQEFSVENMIEDYTRLYIGLAGAVAHLPSFSSKWKP
ncbi:MAG: hypothetical protein DMG06_02080 [Acidobacteria bacterium]|nr:MAG: hypothetical protein DMG06_02080 [Acidobacteriota bacterium]